jgi:hypothetical protein
MSRIPAKEELKIYQGGTLDEQWTFAEPDGTPTDFTGYTAELRIGKDDLPGSVVLILTTSGSAPPASSRLTFGVGTLRIYIKDEATAVMTESQWQQKGTAIKGFQYKGRNTLLFTNAAGETTVENDGPVTFVPIVEPA